MKQPLCLLINDIHVTKTNIGDFQSNWQEALKICLDKGIEDIVIGGDLWETRSGQTLNTLLAVKHAILEASHNDIYLTIAEGNHDLVNQEEEEGYSHLFSEYKNVQCVGTYELLEWEGTDQLLLVVSYFPEDGSFKQHLKDAKAMLSSKGKALDKVTLYIHQGIAGGLPGGFVAPTDLPTDLFDGFKQVLVAHYHNRTHIKGTNIWYIGSSRQKDFGEDEEKGYTVFYDDGSTEFIKNKVNTRYVNIELDFKDLNDFDSEVLNRPNTKVKLKLNCTDTEAKNLNRDALRERGFSRLEIITKKQEKTLQQSSLDTKYDSKAIRNEYVIFCKQEKINSELGEQYLNKIN